MGYDPVVASNVEQHELIGMEVSTMIADLLDREVIRIVHMNGRPEVYDLMEKFQGLELGESDAILTCIKMRREGARARCVLDEKGARAVAGQVGISHVGLVGLLCELASTGTVTAQDMGRIVAALRRTNFRISDDLLDEIARCA